MSRSLRQADYTGLKSYQVEALKKEIKLSHNRDRTGKIAKQTTQNIHHTVMDGATDEYDEDVFMA